MSDFFHGWRRKAGCVTLVMAACLLTIWFRSHVIADSFSVRIGPAIEIETSKGMVEVVHNNIGYVDDSGIRHWVGTTGLSWQIERADQVRLVRVQIGGPSMFGGTKTYLRCSLLWFVLAMTLLSAYLILWPGKRPTKSATQ